MLILQAKAEEEETSWRGDEEAAKTRETEMQDLRWRGSRDKRERRGDVEDEALAGSGNGDLSPANL
ncbi:hypothetical protein ACLOJK_007057 [Asimina triloba]